MYCTHVGQCDLALKTFSNHLNEFPHIPYWAKRMNSYVTHCRKLCWSLYKQQWLHAYSVDTMSNHCMILISSCMLISLSGTHAERSTIDRFQPDAPVKLLQWYVPLLLSRQYCFAGCRRRLWSSVTLPAGGPSGSTRGACWVCDNEYWSLCGRWRLTTDVVAGVSRLAVNAAATTWGLRS